MEKETDEIAEVAEENAMEIEAEEVVVEEEAPVQEEAKEAEPMSTEVAAEV